MNSRERVLAAIAGEETDYVPLSVLLWSSLRRRCANQEEAVLRQVELGMDPVVSLPGIAWKPDPRVTMESRIEQAGPHVLLRKLYRTPAGELEAVVERTADWPHGDDVPLFSDFNIPRSKKFLVTSPDDLPALRHVLREPGAEQVELFRAQAAELSAFADELGLPVVTALLRLADTICWLCGPMQLSAWALTEPQFLHELIALLAHWQGRQLDAYLEAGPDIVVRAEWYASPFLSPALFEKFFAELIRSEVERAHSAGARYCYVGTAGMMPYLSVLIGLGVDVLYGLDPIEGDWNLAAAREQCRGRVALWGGMNGYLQVAQAAPDEVEQAVRQAFETIGRGGGFILCPVDDIGLSGTQEDTDRAWQRTWANVLRMVEAWKKLR